MTFESLTHDFGTIAEDGGTVTHTFNYKSTGKSPVIIVTAVSSCGCTTPIYSRKPVNVGESSTIEVTYDPMDRPGKFAKTIQVVIAPHNKKYVLTITGDVTPRQRTVEELYPFDMGSGLRLSANYYPLSLIEQGERRETQVKYINTSKRELKVGLRPEVKSGMLSIQFPSTIAAGEEGVATVAYDMEAHKGFYGAMSDKYFVDINGKESKYKLMVNAHAVDSFGYEERTRPAIANFSTRIIKLGELKRGRSSSKQSLTIENSGVGQLIIRDVEHGEGLSSSIKAGATVAAGYDRQFTIGLNTKGMKLGTFSKYVTITLNDPDEPRVRIRVTGTIIE